MRATRWPSGSGGGRGEGRRRCGGLLGRFGPVFLKGGSERCQLTLIAACLASGGGLSARALAMSSDVGTYAAGLPLRDTSGPPVTPQDHVQTFTSLSGSAVTIVVRQPVTAGKRGPYFVPPIDPTQRHADGYFKDAIAAAVDGGFSSVVFPDGGQHYELEATLGLQSLTDLTLDGQGSTLDFGADPDAGFGCLLLNGPTRVVVQNFNIDYPTIRNASLGTVIVGADGTHALQLDTAFPIDPLQPLPIRATQVWDRARFAFSRANTTLVATSAAAVTYQGNQVYDFNGALDALPLGTPVVARHYVGADGPSAILVGEASDVTFNGITILSGPGGGMFFNHGRGVWLNGVTVTRSDGRPLSTSMDGLNLAGLDDAIVENCDIAYQGDDCYSLHTELAPVSAGAGSTVTLAFGDDVAVGDRMAFFDGALGFLGVAPAANQFFAGPGPLTLDLGSVLPTLGQARFAANVSAGGSRFYVDHNKFHDHSGRGSLIQSAYGVVQGNEYWGNTHEALLVLADGETFDDGAGAIDVQLIDNFVHDTGAQGASLEGAGISVLAWGVSGVTSVPVHQNLLFLNNRLENLPGPAFNLGQATNVTLQGNAIVAANQQGAANAYQIGGASSTSPVFVANASKVSGSGNTLCDDFASPAVSVDPASTSQISLSVDVGCPASDAGNRSADAGLLAGDGGDAGLSNGGAPQADAGADGPTAHPGAAVSGGCGCTSDGASSLSACGALLALRSRRRSRRASTLPSR